MQDNWRGIERDATACTLNSCAMVSQKMDELRALAVESADILGRCSRPCSGLLIDDTSYHKLLNCAANPLPPLGSMIK